MKISRSIPCVVDLHLPQAAISMVEILEGLGHEVHYPESEACCGQPPLTLDTRPGTLSD